MQVKITHSPSAALALCRLAPGEKMVAQRGSMAYIDGVAKVSGSLGGSIGAVVKRRLLGDETGLLSRYQADARGCVVAVAPSFAGDAAEVDASRAPVLIRRGAFLAAEGSCTVDAKMVGAAHVVARNGLAMLRVAGGKAVLAARGGVISVALTAGRKVTVDSGHLVAADESVTLSPATVGGVAGSAWSGEGLAVVAEGPGQVWVQTRAAVGPQG